MAQSRAETCKEYREALTELRVNLKEESDHAENHRQNQYGMFLLAQKYLRNYPELLAQDCTGRGLPAFNYVWGHYIYGFTMDLKTEEKLKSYECFSEYFKEPAK